MKNLFYLILIFWGISILGLVWVFKANNTQKENHFAQKKQLVQSLLLTDYCLSTESRHTRHISMAEIIAPFQDLPAYLEHFPSSSFFAPNIQRKSSKK